MSYNTSTLLTEAIEHLRTGLDRAQSTSSDMGRAEELSCAFENALPLLDALATPPEAAEAVGAVPASDEVLAELEADKTEVGEEEVKAAAQAYIDSRAGLYSIGLEANRDYYTFIAGVAWLAALVAPTLNATPALLARVRQAEAARLAAPPAAGEAVAPAKGPLYRGVPTDPAERYAWVLQQAQAHHKTFPGLPEGYTHDDIDSLFQWSDQADDFLYWLSREPAARPSATPAAADACEGQCGICSCIPSPPTATATPSNEPL